MVMFRCAVPVCGPLAGGCGSVRPSGPNEADPLDHGHSEAPDLAPPTSSSALSEHSAPHSAASAAYGTPGGPAPDPGRYGWAAQPGRNGEAAATQTHTHDIIQYIQTDFEPQGEKFIIPS